MGYTLGDVGDDFSAQAQDAAGTAAAGIFSAAGDAVVKTAGGVFAAVSQSVVNAITPRTSTSSKKRAHTRSPPPALPITPSSTVPSYVYAVGAVAVVGIILAVQLQSK